jgi:hypothetical protein
MHYRPNHVRDWLLVMYRQLGDTEPPFDFIDYADEKLDEVLSSLERLGIRWFRLFHPKKKPVKHEELHTDNPGYDA